jgi:hypothetical protein
VIRSLVCFIAASIETTILPSDPTDRRLGLIVLIMFFAGLALACREVVGWWKERMEQFERPPLPKLITYEFSSDRLAPNQGALVSSPAHMRYSRAITVFRARGSTDRSFGARKTEPCEYGSFITQSYQ